MQGYVDDTVMKDFDNDYNIIAIHLTNRHSYYSQLMDIKECIDEFIADNMPFEDSNKSATRLHISQMLALYVAIETQLQLTKLKTNTKSKTFFIITDMTETYSRRPFRPIENKGSAVYIEFVEKTCLEFVKALNYTGKNIDDMFHANPRLIPELFAKIPKWAVDDNTVDILDEILDAPISGFFNHKIMHPTVLIYFQNMFSAREFPWRSSAREYDKMWANGDYLKC